MFCHFVSDLVLVVYADGKPQILASYPSECKKRADESAAAIQRVTGFTISVMTAQELLESLTR